MVEYHYFLAVGIDAGIPFNARNRRRDDAAWEEADLIEDRYEVFKKYRPLSTGEGTYWT